MCKAVVMTLLGNNEPTVIGNNNNGFYCGRMGVPQNSDYSYICFETERPAQMIRDLTLP
jgi:hypothetical protein